MDACPPKKERKNATSMVTWGMGSVEGRQTQGFDAYVDAHSLDIILLKPQSLFNPIPEILLGERADTDGGGCLRLGLFRDSGLGLVLCVDVGVLKSESESGKMELKLSGDLALEGDVRFI